jgi:hypothetical protein
VRSGHERHAHLEHLGGDRHLGYPARCGSEQHGGRDGASHGGNTDAEQCRERQHQRD